MNEKQLQAKIVMDYSQLSPEGNGLLWSTRNNTFSLRDGVTQKAMGMTKGVSDLIHFKNKIFTGIEIKIPGAAHKLLHIHDQFTWGEKITKQGGRYFIVTSLFGFWNVINNSDNRTGVYNLEQINELLKESNGTVVF